MCRSVVVCTVCNHKLSVCWTYGQPCENGYTDRHEVWSVDSDKPEEPCIKWGPDFLEKKNLGGRPLPLHC